MESPIKYSDLIQADDSIESLIDKLRQLREEYNGLISNIKDQAPALKTALNGASGASAQGQSVIRETSTLINEQAKSVTNLTKAQDVLTEEIAREAMERKKANAEMRLRVKLANSEEGSYEHLSALYGIQKAKLNAMSQATRENTEEGRALTRQVNELYSKMNDLQKATGKHILSVGDYGIATATLSADIRNAVQALTEMRIQISQLEEAGGRGSAEWERLTQNSQKLAGELKNLKKQYQIVKLETNALGQQTGLLNDAIGAISTASGGLSAATGALNLFGESSAGATEALVQTNSVLAITNGLSQVYNSVFKQGNTLLTIRNYQLKAATIAQSLQTKSTIAARAAQIALNMVAKANPYVLLAGAILAVAGALAGFLAAGARVIKQQKLLNQQNKATLEYMSAYNEELTRNMRENATALEQELTIAKARKASYAETQRYENQIQKAKEKTNRISSKYYEEEIDNLESNRKELERLRKELLKAQNIPENKRVSIQFDAEGPAKKFKASKVISILQDKIDNLGKKVEIATELVTDKKQLDADYKALKEKHKQEMLEVQALERSVLRGAEDVQIALINQRFDKERDIAKANIARQITDLKVRLATESNLTLKARKAINAEIIDLGKKLTNDLIDINNEEIKANLSAIRLSEDRRLEATQESADKRRLILKREFEREIEDVSMRLSSERDLTETETESLIDQLSSLWDKYDKDLTELENQLALERLDRDKTTLENRTSLLSENTTEELELRLEAIETQRQYELVSNRTLAEELRQDEAAINSKYDKLRLRTAIQGQIDINRAKFETDQAYEESVFHLRERSEAEQERFQLEQQRARLRFEIEAHKKLMQTQTGEQKEITAIVIKTLENQINAVDKKIKKTKGKVGSIWELFGLSSEAASAISTVANQVIDALNEIAQARIDAAQAAIDAAQKEIDAAQKAYDYEREARANGYANDVETAQKRLELEKKNQQKAIAEKKKAQKAQLALDTVTQISSLITASANIWSAFGYFPPVAIAMLALMWASFAAAKITAASMAAKSESYGEGTVELLSGGSHQSGNDIDLGTRKDGTKRRAEGGEFFAVINKRNSRKYRDVIPDVINSLNSGTFAQKYMNAYDKMGGIALTTTTGPDVSRIERDVEKIREQNAHSRFIDREGNMIEVYKNVKRKVILS